MNQTKKFFVYDWSSTEDAVGPGEQMVALMYGVDEFGEDVCMNAVGIRPYFYIEVGGRRESETLSHRTMNALHEYLGLGHHYNVGVSAEVVSREGLYFANYDVNTKTRKKFAVVKVSAPTKTRLNRIYWKIASVNSEPFRVGTQYVELIVHEHSRVDHLMQFRSAKDLPAAGWVTASRVKTCVVAASRHSTCRHEFLCRAQDICKTPEDEVPCPVPPFTVVVFDFETYSSDWSRISDSHKETDEIFQVSFASNKGDRVVVVSRPVDRDTVRPGIRVIEVQSEKEILEAFPRIMRELNPHFISGYNIFGFDFPYLSDRATLHDIHDLVFTFGRVPHPAQMKHTEWDSKGRGVQDYRYPAAEGRVVLDLLVYVKKTYTNLHSYKLDSVATALVNASKDPFTHRDIFRSYAGVDQQGRPLSPRDQALLMTTCLNYCMQDSDLTLRIFTSQCTDLVMVQTALVSNTDMNRIATGGEAILNFNLIYKYCTEHGILVENKDLYDRLQNYIYSGATILEPEAGIHENVVSFDFAALYPSVLRAYNIDYTTLVDEEDASAGLIPDEDCHVVEWEQHQGCDHDPVMIQRKAVEDRRTSLMEAMSLIRLRKVPVKDVARRLLKKAELQKLNSEKLKATEDLKKYCKTKYVICQKFRFRYLKYYVGVVPTTVVNLLTARKRIKKRMEELLAEWTRGGATLTPEQQRELDVLDKRQLAFKVTANSMFGVMGARTGQLTFMPGAISTTACGRACIRKMIDLFHTRYNARVIYGDTDSNYVIMNPSTYSTPDELWTLCGRIAKEISADFPEAINLEFENAIYSKFLIPKKKKYMHRKIGRNGEVLNPLHTKGSCLVRRDTFEFMRKCFKDLVMMVFDGDDSVESVRDFIGQRLRLLYSHSVPAQDLVLTKSVKTLTPPEDYMLDSKGVCYVGAYAIRKVPEGLSPETAWEKLVPLLPEHAAVAYSLQKRGAEVSCGSRIEYVYVEPLNAGDSRVSQQVESVYYLDRGLREIHVDKYVARLRQPIEQILPLVNPKLADVVEKQVQAHETHSRVIRELKTLFTPDIVFERQ